MDHAKVAFGSFVPVPEARKYDAAIKQYLVALNSLSADLRAIVRKDAREILQLLDPTVNSIGHFFVFDILYSDPHGAHSIGPESELHDRFIEFLVTFDAVQMRYVVAPLLSLLDRILRCGPFPPAVAIELVSIAMLRLDPSGSTFTPIHLSLASLALSTNAIEPALKILDADILFYPNVAGPRNERLLCDSRLPTWTFMPSKCSNSGPITSTTILEYNYCRAMIYMTRRDWARAQSSLEQVISHPSRDKGVSTISVAAYKKWVLVGLLGQGQAPTLPSYTPSWAQSAYQSMCKPYNSFASLFATKQTAELRAEFESHERTWEEDGNERLVASVMAAWQKWQIMNLRKVYVRVSMSEVLKTVDARTDKALQDQDGARALVQEMIDSGMLRGVVEAGAAAEESYLTFKDDEVLPDAEFAREVVRYKDKMQQLTSLYRGINARLGTERDYVRHLLREQKRAEMDKERDAVLDLEQLDEEDLMTGVMAHA